MAHKGLAILLLANAVACPAPAQEPARLVTDEMARTWAPSRLATYLFPEDPIAKEAQSVSFGGQYLGRVFQTVTFEIPSVATSTRGFCLFRRLPTLGWTRTPEGYLVAPLRPAPQSRETDEPPPPGLELVAVPPGESCSASRSAPFWVASLAHGVAGYQAVTEVLMGRNAVVECLPTDAAGRGRCHDPSVLLDWAEIEDLREIRPCEDPSQDVCFTVRMSRQGNSGRVDDWNLRITGNSGARRVAINHTWIIV